MCRREIKTYLTHSARAITLYTNKVQCITVGPDGKNEKKFTASENCCCKSNNQMINFDTEYVKNFDYSSKKVSFCVRWMIFDVKDVIVTVFFYHPCGINIITSSITTDFIHEHRQHMCDTEIHCKPIVAVVFVVVLIDAIQLLKQLNSKLCENVWKRCLKFALRMKRIH